MIKVEIYYNKCDFIDKTPTAILSLKEFEDKFNAGEYPLSNAYHISFIVV